jgi:hypothetical protein
MQAVANFFVSECRQSNHSFPTPEMEAASLLYNFAPTTDPSTLSYQVYMFPAPV